MFTVVKANKITVAELIELLKKENQNSIVSAAGATEFFINIDDESIIFDEYNLNAYEGFTDTITVNGAAIGEIFADDNKDTTYGFICYDDNHEETGFKSADKAEDALLEYYYMGKSVFVSEHKVKAFMEIAQPQYPFKVENHRQQCVFTFSNEKDLERAEIANGAIMLFDNK